MESRSAARAPRPSSLGVLALGFALIGACGERIEVGTDRPSLGSDSGQSDSGSCEETPCQDTVVACGDCLDNDGDTFIDAEDPDCLGPCQRSEDAFFVVVPAQGQGRCAQDCYFDEDAGFGNDDCIWSHHCDPLALEPDYPPSGIDCAYAVEEPLQGSTTATCETALVEQSTTCVETCMPLTPPGCDCFGCCQLEGMPAPAWIGSRDDSGQTCTYDDLTDPSRCRPCTQVSGCLKPLL